MKVWRELLVLAVYGLFCNDVTILFGVAGSWAVLAISTALLLVGLWPVIKKGTRRLIWLQRFLVFFPTVGLILVYSGLSLLQWLLEGATSGTTQLCSRVEDPMREAMRFVEGH